MNFTKLYFFTAAKTFINNMLEDGFNPDLYYCVFSAPEIELMSKDLPATGEELLYLTTSASWLATGRRKAACGDVIYYKNAYYGYVRNDDDIAIQQNLLNMFGKSNIYQLPKVRPLVLVKLKEKESVYG